MWIRHSDTPQKYRSAIFPPSKILIAAIKKYFGWKRKKKKEKSFRRRKCVRRAIFRTAGEFGKTKWRPSPPIFFWSPAFWGTIRSRYDLDLSKWFKIWVPVIFDPWPPSLLLTSFGVITMWTRIVPYTQKLLLGYPEVICRVRVSTLVTSVYHF